MQRRLFFAGLGLLVLVVNAPLVHRLLLRGPAPVTATLPFTDDFEGRERPGSAYFSTGGDWRIEGGALRAPGVRNNPLWLRAALPRDVRVRFTARSESPEGDLKVELFGDGVDHASGYVFVFGGWKNTITTLARLDEHGADRLERRDLKVVRGKTYEFELERRGGELVWRIDGEEIFRFDDPKPLSGEGHDRFGFSSWDGDAYFDGLSVEAL